MNDLISALSRLGSASVEVLWIPLGLWTLLALFVLALVRVRRDLHPLTHYEIRSALLYALPLGIVLAVLIDAPVTLLPDSGQAVVESVVFGLPTGTSSAVPANIPTPAGTIEPASIVDFSTWLGLITAVAALASLLGLALFIRDAIALRRYRCSLRFVDTGELRGAETLRNVRYAISEDDGVPMTFGLLRPVVVLPLSLIHRPAEMRLALRHEHVHVRRRDYARHWAEQVIAALFAIHPLVFVLRRQIESYRERACDAEVVADDSRQREEYALLLLRASDTCTNAPRPGLPLARRNSSLQHRIAALATYTHDVAMIDRLRRASMAVAGVLVVVIVGAISVCDVFGGPRPVGGEPAPADPTFQLENPHFYIDGEFVERTGGVSIKRIDEVSGFFLYAEDTGLFTFSLDNKGGAGPTGAIEGHVLQFRAGGHQVRVVSEVPILEDGVHPLYAHHYPDYDGRALSEPSRHFSGTGALSYRDGFAFGNWSPIGALLESIPDRIPDRPEGIRLYYGTITFNGVSHPMNGSVTTNGADGFVSLYRRGLGLLVFSRQTFPEADRVARVNENVLTIETPELDLRIDAERAILPEPTGVLWMRWDPDYVRKNGAEGSFTSAGSLEELEAYLAQ